MEPAPTPMFLPWRLFQSLMSSPLRTTRQSLPEPTPATPTMLLVPWPRPSEMSCGPKAVMSRSPEASAVRASAKRWNMTGSIWTLYLAAYSGRSQSGESAGTFSMPSLAFTGDGSGVRRASWAATDEEAVRAPIRASDSAASRRRDVMGKSFPTPGVGRGMDPDTVRITSPSSVKWAYDRHP